MLPPLLSVARGGPTRCPVTGMADVAVAVPAAWPDPGYGLNRTCTCCPSFGRATSLDWLFPPAVTVIA